MVILKGDQYNRGLHHDSASWFRDNFCTSPIAILRQLPTCRADNPSAIRPVIRMAACSGCSMWIAEPETYPPDEKRFEDMLVSVARVASERAEQTTVQIRQILSRKPVSWATACRKKATLNR
jgi:hypothetical protein